MEEESVLIDTVKVERCFESSGVGNGVFDTKTPEVCIDVRALKRFLHRREKDPLFVTENEKYENKETGAQYWCECPSIFVNDKYDSYVSKDLGKIEWNENRKEFDTMSKEPIKTFKIMFFIKKNEKLTSDAELILKRDQYGELYFSCEGEKIENLKVWLKTPNGVSLECCTEKEEEVVESDDPDNLYLDLEECVKFSLQNVTENIKHLNLSFNEKNSNEFTIYYFVETKDSNGEYEFDSCETISLSKDKIGNEDVMLGYISAHNGKPVETKKIKMFIASGNCKKFDFEGKKSTSNKQMDLLRKKGFTELDVKRGTDKQTDKYCVVYDGRRIDKESIGSFSDTKSWSNNSFNKINDINVNECGINAEKKQLRRNKTSTPDSNCESKSKKAFTYTGTNEDSENEKQAIENYLDKKVDSVIWYANPNVVKDLNEKGYGLSHLEKKNCIIIDVSELCNSLVYRYKNNDKNLWFFQRWYAKFTLFFNIGKVAKILKWKEQYKSGDDTQQIKSSLSNNDNENNKIKNENEKREEEENMAAPPGYTNNLLQ